jgi:hypothetical protein
MSATTQPAAPQQQPNGQTAAKTRTTRKRRRTAAKRAATTIGTTARKQPASAATTTTRRLPTSAELPMPTRGNGPPHLMMNLVQALPGSGSPFTQQQRTAWLKAAEANLAVAYPLSEAA